MDYVTENSILDARVMSNFNTRTALMAQIHPETEETPIADIVNSTCTAPPVAELGSEREIIMNTIHATIRTESVSRSRMGFAPSWVVRGSFLTEYNSNLADVFS